MTSSESETRRRKPARKANGSGTVKQRKDGRYEGQVFVRTTSGKFKRVSLYGRSWEECDKKICAQGWDAKRPEGKRRCCAVGQCCGRVPNPARVHHVFRTLRAALGVAVAEEVLTRNVASFAKPTRPRRHRFQKWGVTEATTFLAAIREHRLYARFAVAIARGMRRGEARVNGGRV